MKKTKNQQIKNNQKTKNILSNYLKNFQNNKKKIK